MFTKKSLFALAITSLVAQSSNAMTTTVTELATKFGKPAAEVVSALGRTSGRGRVSAEQALAAERKILGSNLVPVVTATPWATRAANAVRTTAWDANMAVGRGILKAIDAGTAAAEAAAPTLKEVTKQAKIAGQKYSPERVSIRAQRAARRNPEEAGYVAASVAGIMASAGIYGAWVNYNSQKEATTSNDLITEAANHQDFAHLDTVYKKHQEIKAAKEKAALEAKKAAESRIISKNYAFNVKKANNTMWNWTIGRFV